MRVDKNTLEYTLRKILVLNGVSEEKAIICANNLTENSLYGVVSHGVNRFPRLISMIRKGYIHPNAEPECREVRNLGRAPWPWKLQCHPLHGSNISSCETAWHRMHCIAEH